MREQLLKDLRELRGCGPGNPNIGICQNLPRRWQDRDSVEAIRNLMAKWPEYSGNRIFPVQHPEMTPKQAYLELEDLWTGPYGEARRRLLDFLITKLEAEE